MPRIPISRVRASAATPSGFVPQTRANQSDFNVATTSVGNALQNLGAGIGQLGQTIDNVRKEQRIEREQEELANVNAQSDPTPALLAARDASQQDGSDLIENTRTAYQDWIRDTADGIENPNVRSAFRRYWLGRAPNVMSTAAIEADKMYDENSRFELGQSLAALENRVRVDPQAYDDALTLGLDAIAPHARLNTAQTRTAWQQQVARARFEALIEQASTPADLDLLRAEVGSEDWQAALSPSDFDDTVDAIEARRSALRTGAVSNARSSITDVEQRTNNLERVSREELTALNAQVAASGDPVLAERLARASRDQYLLRMYGSLGPEQLSARASAMRSEGPGQGVHPQVAAAVDEAVTYTRGRVSAGYLSAVANMEYGGFLGEENPDFSRSASTSSATGLYQFTDATWLAVVRGEGNSLVQGAGTMDDAELLAMRSDPVLSAKAAAVLATRNADQMQSALARPPTEFELYLAHFLGAGRAVQMVRAYETDETQVAAALFPAEAEANRNVFYDATGETVDTPRTIREVYDALASRFSTTPGRVQYGDADFVESMADNADARMRENMMGYAREVGIAAVPPLDEENAAAARANAARIVSSTWQIPLDEVRPLEPQEVSYYQNILSGDNPDAKTEVMALFAGMGPVLAQQAYQQLGVEGRVYAHGAGLMDAGGDPGAAYNIVRGQTFIDNNPDYIKAIGLDRQQVLDEFGTQLQVLTANMGQDAATGGAWQTVLDAAFAHYVQTASRRGVQGLDKDAFERSLNFVLGGTDASPVLYEFNGAMTVLPQGVSPQRFEQWVYYASDTDWTAASTRGLPARYGNGDLVSVETLRNNATFEAVGAGSFRVKVDGQYLTTGRDTATGAELWVVQLTPESMARNVDEGITRVKQNALSVDAQQYLRNTYGFSWAYDDQGRRLPDEEIERRRREARDMSTGAAP